MLEIYIHLSAQCVCIQYDIQTGRLYNPRSIYQSLTHAQIPVLRSRPRASWCAAVHPCRRAIAQSIAMVAESGQHGIRANIEAADMTTRLQIGELARASGASVRMLRFYEQLGLLAPARNAAGYRLYSAADIALVRKVRLLNQAGLPLKTLALMRDCLRDEPQEFCAELRGTLRAQQMEIARQMALLAQSQALPASLLEK